MKYLVLLVFLCGCSTIATQSEDGKTLKIKGGGSAKFENGAEIEGGSFIPKFPAIKVSN